MHDGLAALIVGAVGAGGIFVSNWLVDRNLDVYLARRIPALAGGAGFLLSTIWMEPWNAVALGFAITFVLFLMQWKSPRRVRGVSGSSDLQRWVSVTFVASGTVSLAVGWGLFEERSMALLPVGFLALGDTAAGVCADVLTRVGVSHRYWPSLAMLLVCVAVAVAYEPVWVGILAAVVATVVEKNPPIVAGVQDDNWVIVWAALLVLGGFYWV